MSPHLQKTHPTPSIHKVSPKNCEVPPIEGLVDQGTKEKGVDQKCETRHSLTNGNLRGLKTRPAALGSMYGILKPTFGSRVKFMVNVCTLQIQDYPQFWMIKIPKPSKNSRKSLVKFPLIL